MPVAAVPFSPDPDRKRSAAVATPYRSLLADARQQNAAQVTARGRLDTLASTLATPMATNPTQSTAYRARMGSLLDGLREQSGDDAGRAFASGTVPGLALAAGAGQRSRALATGVRSASADAEGAQAGDQARRLAALMQVLGLQSGLDERDRDRTAAQRNQWLSALASVAGAGAGFALAGPAGGAAGGKIGGSIGSRIS